jgi:arylamine N-acetyltransferase
MSSDTIIANLDPTSHKASVRHFFSFFDLIRQKPGVPFLSEILTHFAKLPYENISKIVKLRKHFTSPDRIRLPEEVMADFDASHLGGTCFSLTYFLYSILIECDFLCYPVIAHMQREPNSHCALVLVFQEKKYLIDPGYVLNHPLQINKDVSRYFRTEHTGVETRFNSDDENFYVNTFHDANKKFRYKFKDAPLSMQDFLQHWLGSFYWPGMRGICLSQINQNGMVYVNNDYVQVQNERGKKKGHVDNIHLLVKEEFHIDPEWVERAQAALPDIISNGQIHGYYREK